MTDDRMTHAEYLGRLAMVSARIELYTAGIASTLTDPTEAETGSVVLHALDHRFRAMADLASALVPVRLTADSPAHHLAEPIADWLSRAKGFMTNDRNRYMHAVWMVSPGTDTATVLVPKRPKDEPENYWEITLERLSRIVDRGDRLGVEGSDLWEDLIYRYGHLDALIAATELAEEIGFEAVFGTPDEG